MQAFLKIAIGIAVLAFLSPASAREPLPFDGGEMVMIENGIISTDIDGDGIKDMVVTGHRENFNAHDFYLTNVYIQVKLWNDEPEWQAVPWFDQKDKEHSSMTRSGGADCVPYDFRLVRTNKPGSPPLYLVIGERESGESAADPGLVTFDIYHLQSNSMTGSPARYFEYERTIRTTKKYCEINEAFQAELGLKRYRPDPG